MKKRNEVAGVGTIPCPGGGALGMTGEPLSKAAQNGHERCAALLRAAGAKDVR